MSPVDETDMGRYIPDRQPQPQPCLAAAHAQKQKRIRQEPLLNPKDRYVQICNYEGCEIGSSVKFADVPSLKQDLGLAYIERECCLNEFSN